MQKHLYWSFHTGEYYEVLEDEVEMLDSFQVRLKQRAKSDCKKCYGRFYIGLNASTGLYLPCQKCGKKCLDFEWLKPDDNDNSVNVLGL